MMKTFLNKVYATKGTANTRKLYDEWAASYDAETSQHGYVTPDRCAEALARFVPNRDLPILDFGCGTGVSGLALKQAGFNTIDGMDLSTEMLAQAEAKGIYRTLTVVPAGTRAPLETGSYNAIAAIGVIGAGAAPAKVLDDVMKALPCGGKFVFSFNDHTLNDPIYEARVMEWTDCGAARLLFREHGDHLPGINLKSNVYVLEKI